MRIKTLSKAATALALSGALLLTGCQKAADSGAESKEAKAGTSNEVVEIEYLSHKSEKEAIEAVDTLIEKFNKENPNIKVIHTPSPDFTTVLTTRAQTNEMPDVFSLTTNNTYEMMFRDGLIMDLTGQEFLNNVKEETLELSKFEGKNWRLPYSLSAYGIYVRTDIFKEYGIEIPSTYEELMKAAEELKAKGITPFNTQDKDLSGIAQRMERVMGIIDATDTEFKKIADGTLLPQDSVVLKTYAQISNDITKYTTADSLGVDQTAIYQNYANDGGAMLIQGTWALTTLKNYNPEMEVALIPFPNPTSGETKVPISIDTSFCIAAETEHKEEALKFLEFLSRTENAQAYTDFERSPNVIKGVEYKVDEFAAISEKMDKGEIFVSLNALWPSGLRNELRDPAQLLIMDGNENAFIDSAGEIIKNIYNNQ